MKLSSLLQYRPAAVAVATRRQLDNTRYSVAAGFMLLFLDRFRAVEVLNSYDQSRSSADWQGFKRALEDFYGIFHPLSNVVGGTNDGIQMRQALSIFSCCFESRLLTIGSQEKVDALKGEPLSGSGFQGSAIIGEFDNRTQRLMGENGDASVKRQLDFCVPAFIWAYNVLKKALIDDDNAILKTKNFEYGMVDMTGPAPDLEPSVNTVSRFTIGTALEQRKDSYWREYLRISKLQLGGGGQAAGGSEARQEMQDLVEEEDASSDDGSVKLISRTYYYFRNVFLLM